MATVDDWIDACRRQGIRLRRRGQEHCGPCPICQTGDDRFWIKARTRPTGARPMPARAHVPATPPHVAGRLLRHPDSASPARRREPNPPTPHAPPRPGTPADSSPPPTAASRRTSGGGSRQSDRLVWTYRDMWLVPLKPFAQGQLLPGIAGARFILPDGRKRFQRRLRLSGLATSPAGAGRGRSCSPKASPPPSRSRSPSTTRPWRPWPASPQTDSSKSQDGWAQRPAAVIADYDYPDENGVRPGMTPPRGADSPGGLLRPEDSTPGTHGPPARPPPSSSGSETRRSCSRQRQQAHDHDPLASRATDETRVVRIDVDTGNGFRAATIAEIDQALRQLPLFGAADAGEHPAAPARSSEPSSERPRSSSPCWAAASTMSRTRCAVSGHASTRLKPKRLGARIDAVETGLRQEIRENYHLARRTDTEHRDRLRQNRPAAGDPRASRNPVGRTTGIALRERPSFADDPARATARRHAQPGRSPARRPRPATLRRLPAGRPGQFQLEPTSRSLSYSNIRSNPQLACAAISPGPDAQHLRSRRERRTARPVDVAIRLPRPYLPWRCSRSRARLAGR